MDATNQAPGEVIDENGVIDQNDVEENADEQKKRRRRVSSIPVLSYEESLAIANAIWEFGSGQKIRRLTLFDQLGKSPDSGPSRTLVTNSSKYGITIGGYQAEYLELTPTGALATNPDTNTAERLQANFSLAILENDYFKYLYDAYKDMKVPSSSVLVDYLIDKGLDKTECKKCVELFLSNAKYIGLIQVLSGSERILTIEHLLDNTNHASIANKGGCISVPVSLSKPHFPSHESSYATASDIITDNQWDDMCFYITPIGELDTDERKHADLFFSSIVEPALEEYNLKLIRADMISNPGMITNQIIEHILKAKMVIADLSFNNPNVFYELSLRHFPNLPTIHIIRKQDKIPFDVHNFRTIVIDTTDIYSLVPQLDSYKAEISRQVRKLLGNPEAMENPISAYIQANKKK